MAKKRRSSVSSVRPRSYSEMFKDQTSQASPAARPRPTVAVAKSRKAALNGADRSLKGNETVDWTGDYAYVLRDIRWLFIVSGLLFIVLIVASFFM